MRNDIPKTNVKLKECGIINLDNFEGSGTHWTAYNKTNQMVTYFDSYGNLSPPKELRTYTILAKQRSMQNNL